MTYLDFDKIAHMRTSDFKRARPYPWSNPAGLLRPEAYDTLVKELPTLDQMTPSFGVERGHGQQPHDRYALEYDPKLSVSDSWHQFIAELQSEPYLAFLKRMFGRRQLALNFHWHYAPKNASVSPHCDARHKLGSHIFYFMPAQHWAPEWGGQTLILDDKGEFPHKSAPTFDDFPNFYSGDSVGNYSLLFRSMKNAWHGMKPLACPEGCYRKVFILVINDKAYMQRRRLKKQVKSFIRRDK